MPYGNVKGQRLDSFLLGHVVGRSGQLASVTSNQDAAMKIALDRQCQPLK